MAITQTAVGNQVSIEKKTYLFKAISFAFLQVSILSFGVMLGLWIVSIMRWGEMDTNPQVKIFFNCAIAFTAILLLSIIVTGITYWGYLKNRNTLDGYIDSSVKNIAQNKKPNININVVTPKPVQKPEPVANAALVQKQPAAPVGLVKKVVTTTTTTTNTTKPATPSQIGGPKQLVGPTPGASPMSKPMMSGATPIGAKPAMPTAAPRPSVTPMGVRPTMPTAAPRPGVTPMGAKPTMPSVAPRPGVAPMSRPGTPSIPPRPSVAPTPMKK